MIVGARRLPPLPNPVEGYMPCRGGLDTETPQWEVKEGRLSAAKNYEYAIAGGYIDVEGYERLDGRPAPSDASFAALPVVISGALTVGDVVTGSTSAATATIAFVDTTVLPVVAVLTKLTGVFASGENLLVSAVVEAVTAGAATVDSGGTPQKRALYRAYAAEIYRSDIQPVPGEGPVLGVAELMGARYAVRNTVGGTAAKLYKDSVSGWVEVALGRELVFSSGGTFEVAEGMTITGATSGATALVTRVGLQTGSFASGDAAGRLFFASQTGTFVAENINVGATTNVATVPGNSTAITLLPSGSYEFYESNFSGQSSTERLYGADGVNRAFEFDGSVFAPIVTGMPVDAPRHIIVHKQHLFMAFGASVQVSGIGAPFQYTLLSGADEIKTDSEITGFQREPSSEAGGALGIYNRERLHLLYGSSTADFALNPFRDRVGAYRGTIQQVGHTMFLDDRGLTSLRTAQEYGNFNNATVSEHIQRYIDERKALAVSSCIVRSKNQYRIFFSNNDALYVTMDKDKVAAMMPVVLEHRVACVSSVERAGGLESIIFGSTDGYVYKMDSGTSFDGSPISAFITWHYTNKNIRREKRWLNPVTIEAQGSTYAELGFGYDLGYGVTSLVPGPPEETKALSFSESVRWDEPGFTWDSGLVWDGRTLQPTTGIDFRGVSENVAFTLRKASSYTSPVRITGIHYRYLIQKAKK